MSSDSINWTDYIRICVGMMNMRPADFWNLSPREMYLAIQGFKDFNSSSEEEQPMDSDRLQEMMELYPDG